MSKDAPITLQDDIAFKYIFKEEKFLRDFINSFLEYIGLNERHRFSKVEVESIIFPDHKDKKTYYGDIIVNLSNGDIINVEVYKNRFSRNEHNKSCCYMYRLYSNQMNISQNDYTKNNKVISLNLIKGNYNGMNSAVLNEYKLCNVITKKVLPDDNLQMYFARLDLANKLTYNKRIKRFIKWLKLISSNSMKELEHNAKGDEIMEEALAQFKYWEEIGLFRTFDDYIKEHEVEARYEGIDIEKRAMARKMLANNEKLEKIVTYTELSLDEIKKINVGK